MAKNKLKQFGDGKNKVVSSQNETNNAVKQDVFKKKI